MVDVHDKETRSYNMSQVKSKNTKLELLVRKHIHRHGFRYSTHRKKLPGSPDIVLRKYKTVINVHGCYYHRHKNCKLCTSPAATSLTNWPKKFEQNIQRDKKNSKALKKLGWKEITIWECKLKPSKIERTLNSLVKKLSRFDIK